MDPEHVNPYNAGPAQISSPVAPGSVMASPTTIDYSLDLDDYLAWSWHKISTTPHFVRQQRLVRLVAPLLLVLLDVPLVMLMWGSDPMVLVFIGSLLPSMALGIAFNYPSAYRRRVMKNLTVIYHDTSNRALHGTRRMQITETGILTTSELFESFLRWPLVIRIDVTERCVFFDTGGFGGVIVPRRAFGHDAVFDAFVATVRRYHQAAQDADLVRPEIVSS